MTAVSPLLYFTNSHELKLSSLNAVKILIMTSKSIDVKTFYGIQTSERTWIHLKTFCNMQDCEQFKNITTSKKMFFTRKRKIKKYDHIEKYKNMSKSAILYIPLLKVPKSQNEHIINQIRIEPLSGTSCNYTHRPWDDFMDLDDFDTLPTIESIIVDLFKTDSNLF